MNTQDLVIADRYARALFLAARDAKVLDAVRQDLKAAALAWTKDAAFREGWKSPRTAAADKKGLLSKALGRAPQTLTDRFMGLALAKKRVGLLVLIADRFEAHADEALGRVQVKVRSAAALTDAQAQSLAAGLEKTLKAKVAVDVAVEPSLLSGITVRAGDRLWDLSLKGRLARLKEKLLETAAN